LNGRLQAAGLPVRAANLSSIWTVYYTVPSRYNWMLQYYLRAEGLALSWVGTGRLVFSLNFTDGEFAAVADRFVAACQAMRDEGWWWTDGSLTNRSIRWRILREMWAHSRFGYSESPSGRQSSGQDSLPKRCFRSRRLGSVREAEVESPAGLWQ
jgi:glutamate-1-semialdehyde 2,1-aminomutase